MSDLHSKLDPEIAAFAARLRAAWAVFPDLARRSYAEQRAAAETVRAPWRQGGPQVAWRELAAPAAGGAVRVRLYRPADPPRPAPVLVYAHGGGFTTFSLDTHDRIMREYAARAGVVVAGLDYALSPEAKFPRALDQTTAVVEWLAAGGAEPGLDPARIAVGGDSAGANLALAAAVALRDRGRGDLIKALLLAYGFFDDETGSPSQRAFGQPGALLSSEELTGFVENYVGGTPHRDHPLAFPAKADLHDLPPSFHLIAECDPLADSDRAVAARMAALGNAAETRVYAGATHSFLEAVSIAAVAERAFAESAAWLAAALSG